MKNYTLGDLLNRIRSHAFETTGLREDDISIVCQNEFSSIEAPILNGSKLEREIIDTLTDIIAYYIADNNNPKFALTCFTVEKKGSEHGKVIIGYDIKMGVKKRDISADNVERPLELMYAIGKRLEVLKIKFPPEIECTPKYNPVRLLKPQSTPMKLLIPQRPKIESFVFGKCTYVDPKHNPGYQSEVITIYIPKEYVNLDTRVN